MFSSEFSKFNSDPARLSEGQIYVKFHLYVYLWLLTLKVKRVCTCGYLRSKNVKHDSSKQKAAFQNGDWL